MDCAVKKWTKSSEKFVFDDYCVDFTANSPNKPKVLINQSWVNFNITNEAVFEHIDFEGNDNFAFYQESDNRGKPVEEFPVQMCK